MAVVVVVVVAVVVVDLLILSHFIFSPSFRSPSDSPVILPSRPLPAPPCHPFALTITISLKR
ncbi:hypothetical protein E2C01_060796 [Portunus trituberculatus]|uniref:Uncharacterized protein n=1 Tax=Portunus trituberculatus TaxID=210409 RepID=A0A5B7HAG3_PORTR|nr:hypothetical protein [Portunus trituberculatus]